MARAFDGTKSAVHAVRAVHLTLPISILVKLFVFNTLKQLVRCSLSIDSGYKTSFPSTYITVALTIDYNK